MVLEQDLFYFMRPGVAQSSSSDLKTRKLAYNDLLLYECMITAFYM